MKVYFKKDETAVEPFCNLHGKSEDKSIQNAMNIISSVQLDSTQNSLIAWDGDYLINLDFKQIIRLFSENKKVFAETEKETLLVKYRLYELEEFFEKQGNFDFIRISNTEIVNLSFAQKFDFSLTGTIAIILDNNKKSFVSRRYIPVIKKKLNLKKGLK